MKRTTETRPWFKQYIVACYDIHGKAWYVAGYRNGRYKWTRDPLYARSYSKRTAQQHTARIHSTNDPILSI